MEKVTIRKVRSSELRASQPQVPKRQFILYGNVIKVSEKSNSVLVERGGSTTSFWISCYDKLNEIKVGSPYRFVITISSYINKSDSDYVTHLSITDFRELDEKEYKESFASGLLDACIPAKILSSHKTDIPGLFILTAVRMKDGEEMETYHFRYYAKDKLHPHLGLAMIHFTINKCKDVINHQGESNVYLETRTYINDEGEEVTVETPRYKPCLSVLELNR